MTVLSVARDVFAGTGGGVAFTMVSHPFDTLKVYMATQPGKKPTFNDKIHCFKLALKGEGIGGLYKGVASPLKGQMAFRASFFGAFGSAKRWLGTNSDGTRRELTAADFYKAGAITGFVAAFIEGPIDFYNSQMRMQILRCKTDPNYRAPYTNLMDCVKATIRVNGIRGPYQALGPTIVRNTPANSIFLGTFQVLKEDTAKMYNCPVSELPPYVIMGAAGVGALLYWMTIFPVDVVKSAMAADSIRVSERNYPTMMTTIQKLWAEGGIKRFYRGLSPCLRRACPANMAMLYTVDRVTNRLS